MARRKWVPVPGILTPVCLEVLGAVMRLPSPITIRGIMLAMGQRWPNAVYRYLKHLRNEGLISFESHRGGTIRSCCKVEVTNGQA